ncbi:uncharacterized protein LOC129905363 [Episyrphus balteatus]|uniref:uncharacterized protein LOC129905363 n=1 Tax=Episyrphus balteatus TaxID=286459 RepID=UPI002486397F|nr:uncharacterized protein LOC129905363 [Episyrphus balteatus]
MKIYQIITLFAILFGFDIGDANKFNISYSHLDTCKEYTILSLHRKYKDYFQISSMKNRELEDNQRLHLKFYVMTQKDAHILLSEFENQSYSDPVYEIVFGGYNNTRSHISLQNENTVSIFTTPNLLSTFDPMPIEIIQTNDGQLMVNIPGFAEPLLTYSDTSPLSIRFVSLTSWRETSAKWFYDCKLEELTKSEKRQPDQNTVKNKFKKPATQVNPVDSPNKSDSFVMDKNKTHSKIEIETKVQQCENILKELSNHFKSIFLLLVALIGVGICMFVYYKHRNVCCQRILEARSRI